MFGRKVLLLSVAVALAAGGSATAGGLKPGQYSLGGVQRICLTADGAWYGVTFPFKGHWRDAPGADDSAPIWGGYESAGAGAGRYHDTLNVENAVADWYEWNEAGSYSVLLAQVPFARLKSRCDAPAAAMARRPATR